MFKPYPVAARSQTSFAPVASFPGTLVWSHDSWFPSRHFLSGPALQGQRTNPFNISKKCTCVQYMRISTWIYKLKWMLVTANNRSINKHVLYVINNKLKMHVLYKLKSTKKKLCMFHISLNQPKYAVRVRRM